MGIGIIERGYSNENPSGTRRYGYTSNKPNSSTDYERSSGGSIGVIKRGYSNEKASGSRRYGYTDNIPSPSANNESTSGGECRK